MKKESLLLIAVMLMVFTGVGKSFYRVRYSPYAFSYNYPSGLVPGYVRYSPYAFNYKHPSGLIDMYSGSLFPHLYYFPSYDCPSPIIVQPSKPFDRPKVKERIDGKWIVYNYLRSKGLDVDIVDGFCFRNQSVSTVFLVRSKNLLIKYQNPGVEKSLEGNPWWERY